MSDIDPYKFLEILLNPDGTITRLYQDPRTSPTSDPNLPISVLSKDITLNQSKPTFLRLYLPRKALIHSSSFTTTPKLPLILFFHGGGFIFHSAASTIFHDFCFNMAAHLNAVVASLDYRPAPEHRLPAAYDDAIEALHWIKTSPDDWLAQYADYSNCYLMGASAGGSIAYHAGLHAAAEVDLDHLEPVKIEGLILIQPFFGGTKRTPSELRVVNDPVLALPVSDLMWELSLPVGFDRDHEYCNLTAGDGPKILNKMGQLGWRVLVTGCDGDPLLDRQKALMRLMEEEGVAVMGHFVAGDYHAVEFRDPLKEKKLLELLKTFIASSSSFTASA